MRHITKAAAAVASIALLLSACSSGDDTTTTESSSPAAATSGSLLIWADEKRAAPMTELANTWGTENGVQVTVTQVNFDGMKDTYVKQAPGGQGPDILSVRMTGPASSSPAA